MKAHLTTLLVLHCLLLSTSGFGADAPHSQGPVVDVEMATERLLEWGHKLARARPPRSYRAVKDQMEAEVALWPRDVTSAAAMAVMRRRMVKLAVTEFLIGSLSQRGLVGHEFGMELAEFVHDECGPTLQRSQALMVLLVADCVFQEQVVPREELVDLMVYAIARDTTDVIRQRAICHAWQLNEPRVLREVLRIAESESGQAGSMARRSLSRMRWKRKLWGSLPPDLRERAEAVVGPYKPPAVRRKAMAAEKGVRLPEDQGVQSLSDVTTTGPPSSEGKLEEPVVAPSAQGAGTMAERTEEGEEGNQRPGGPASGGAPVADVGDPTDEIAAGTTSLSGGPASGEGRRVRAYVVAGFVGAAAVACAAAALWFARRRRGSPDSE